MKDEIERRAKELESLCGPIIYKENFEMAAKHYLIAERRARINELWNLIKCLATGPNEYGYIENRIKKLEVQINELEAL